ncbi:MAG: hypothetical protein IKL48_00190 [Elusimicrobiaceae bacterium]|nr:hypothetical protein [Elusimicrobiaceae bacterium]
MSSAWIVLIGAVGAVWCIAALAAKVARQKVLLAQKEQEKLANEKVDNAIDRANTMDRDECLERLRGGSGK